MYNFDNTPAMDLSTYISKRNVLDQYYTFPESSSEYFQSIAVANEMIEKSNGDNQLSLTGLRFVKEALNQDPFNQLADDIKRKLLIKSIRNSQSMTGDNINPDDLYFIINIDTYYQRFSRAIIISSGCKDSLALNPLASNDDILLTALMCKVKMYISDEEIHQVLSTHFEWNDWLKRIALAVCIIYRNVSKLNIEFGDIVNQIQILSEEDENMIEKIIYKNRKEDINTRINNLITDIDIWKIVFHIK